MSTWLLWKITLLQINKIQCWRLQFSMVSQHMTNPQFQILKEVMILWSIPVMRNHNFICLQSQILRKYWLFGGVQWWGLKTISSPDTQEVVFPVDNSGDKISTTLQLPASKIQGFFSIWMIIVTILQQLINTNVCISKKMFILWRITVMRYWHSFRRHIHILNKLLMLRISSDMSYQ